MLRFICDFRICDLTEFLKELHAIFRSYMIHSLSWDCLHTALNMEAAETAANEANCTNSANNGNSADRADGVNVGLNHRVGSNHCNMNDPQGTVLGQSNYAKGPKNTYFHRLIL